MNNEYYGVAFTPIDDFLAHYGVRGMKWGVRKSIVDGHDAKSNAYIKAEKKLKKTINKKTNSGVKLTKKQRQLESEWKNAYQNMQNASEDRKNSILGRWGYGKTQAAYTQAARENRRAAEAFFNSMPDRKRIRYHNKHLY